MGRTVLKMDEELEVTGTVAEGESVQLSCPLKSSGSSGAMVVVVVEEELVIVAAVVEVVVSKWLLVVRPR